jgi:hypothetical protein
MGFELLGRSGESTGRSLQNQNCSDVLRNLTNQRAAENPHPHQTDVNQLSCTVEVARVVGELMILISTSMSRR